MRIRGKGLTSRALLFVLLLGFASIPAFAGSAVVGSVAGSMNATLGGQPLLPNSAIFSGDSLKVKDGATVIALASGSRLVFGRETEARFLREGDRKSTRLNSSHGYISYAVFCLKKKIYDRRASRLAPRSTRRRA